MKFKSGMKFKVNERGGSSSKHFYDKGINKTKNSLEDREVSECNTSDKGRQKMPSQFFRDINQ